MTVEKSIRYEEGVRKANFVAQIRARWEKAKREGKFKGDLEEFILKEKIRDIGFAKGGKANGSTTFTSSDWDEILREWEIKKMELDEDYLPNIIDPEDVKLLKRKVPNKLVAYKFGATSQSEEDLIGGHVDDWTNEINKGELDPSVNFMQYLDMILGRNKMNRGGIISAL